MFSSCFSDCGEVICWGENNYGQLAISPDESKEVTTPYIIPGTLFEGKVMDIQTGWTHVIAVTGIFGYHSVGTWRNTVLIITLSTSRTIY